MTPVEPIPIGGWQPLPGRGAGFVRTAWRERFAAAGLSTIQDFLNAEGEALTKAGLGTRYRARLRVGSEVAYLKRFHGDKLLDRLKRWREDGIWHSPAERELRAADFLRAANIPATQTLAWGKQTSGGTEHSFVVLSAAPGEPADKYLLRPRSPAALGGLARRLAELAKQFHAAGLRHRDFYLCHVFVAEAETGNFELTLIDLQRVFRPRDAKGRWRIKDLAQLNYSAAAAKVSERARLRFFFDYFAGETTTSTRRQWLRRIQKRTEAMIQRYPLPQ
jgi:heptose I phosphotransferase